MRLRQAFGGVVAAAAVAAVGCGEKAAGPTPPDPGGNTKVLKDKAGKTRGAVDDSFADPNYKK